MKYALAITQLTKSPPHLGSTAGILLISSETRTIRGRARCCYHRCYMGPARAAVRGPLCSYQRKWSAPVGHVRKVPTADMHGGPLIPRTVASPLFTRTERAA